MQMVNGRALVYSLGAASLRLVVDCHRVELEDAHEDDHRRLRVTDVTRRLRHALIE